MALTDKQVRFCEEYLVDYNATQAAVRAGYSKKTAGSIGHENLTKPEIREFIDKKLVELSLSAGETTKLISDIARSSLNEYFTIREVVRTPQIVIPLKQAIKKLKEEIEDANKFIQRSGISDTETLQQFSAQQEMRRLEILRHEIELERNPGATILASGKPVLEKVAELDMARLVEDKKAGRIKSVKPTEFGLNVELYPADGALRDLARIHGLFEKDNSQTKGDLIVNIE